MVGSFEVLGARVSAAGVDSEPEATPNNLATVSHEDRSLDGGSAFTGLTATEGVSSKTWAAFSREATTSGAGCEGSLAFERPLGLSRFAGELAFLCSGSIDGVPSISAREFQWSDMYGVDADGRKGLHKRKTKRNSWPQLGNTHCIVSWKNSKVFYLS